jgi:hypothetical protein
LITIHGLIHLLGAAFARMVACGPMRRTSRGCGSPPNRSTLRVDDIAFNLNQQATPDRAPARQPA